MVFIKSSKNQSWTLPPDIRDLIPSDHICYLVESFVYEMDFSEFEIRYDGSGHPAYHPCIICKILIQSMLDRVRPSRAIARNVRENVVYMYLAENLQPDFRTISDFTSTQPSACLHGLIEPGTFLRRQRPIVTDIH